MGTKHLLTIKKKKRSTQQVKMFSFNEIKFSFQKHVLTHASSHPSNEAGKIFQKTEAMVLYTSKLRVTF